MRQVSVPVVLFHTVRPQNLPWFWSHISHPPELFEAYLTYLKSKGYRTVLLPDVIGHIRGDNPLPDRSIALTFDDGYLDNWTIAAPLLKKYDFCGTVFVNPEFVDPREIIREQVSPDNPSEVTRDQVDGFMSWNELKAVQNSGILDVQSHAMTHTWYFKSDKIIDFHHPGDQYPWLAWNVRPDRKHLWMTEDQSNFVDFGVPVYEYDKSLITRRYFEPEEMNTKLAQFVKDNGGTDFFKQRNWRNILSNEASKHKTTAGHIESKEEYEKRILWELQASKEEITSRLSKSIDIISWPCGGHNASTLDAAKRLGYIGWAVRGTSNISKGTDPYTIHRISIPIMGRWIFKNLIDKQILVYKVESVRGAFAWRQARKVIRRVYAFTRAVRKRI